MKRKNKKMLICQQKNSFYEKKARKNDDYQLLNAGDSNDNDRCGFSRETTKKRRRKSHFPHLLSIISLIFLIKIEHLLVGASEPTSTTTTYNNNNTSDFDESKIFGHFQGRSGSRTYFFRQFKKKCSN